jgi:dethiobiotin synthetase
VVSPNVIGAINQTLQTLVTASCFRGGIHVAGVILNDSRMFDGDLSMETNRQQIASRSMAPVLTRVQYEADEFEEKIDWMAIAKSRSEQEAELDSAIR